MQNTTAMQIRPLQWN